MFHLVFMWFCFAAGIIATVTSQLLVGAAINTVKRKFLPVQETREELQKRLIDVQQELDWYKRLSAK